MKVKIARIGKPHGVKGEVTAQLFTDSPNVRFAPGATIFTDRKDVPQLTVKGHRWNKERILLNFDQITSRTVAEQFRNTLLFAAEMIDSQEDKESWYPHEIEGLNVLYEEKIIGSVVRMELRPVQDLLTVLLIDGSEVLIPFVKEIVPDINLDSKTMTITPPLGLLE